ncbi:hypothetical protein [Sporomusa sphaeroides]|uniref:RsbT co-antagonist protein RsbRD N-terminal domain-containing protein n=1 Tax=Sporomusa sphaeroides DSM 2875 TaxID=1337886 RepID=A0ABM9W678_9FIRM|nr:hypothetical protein [Sporomusa sphaeroides]OLS54421.1 hypothetical protein SPSPH_45030 [Sporomusa sphaeroides DSM 2875]CVK20664.1 hypothetical protein SSPH_03332 [Sporomusa sphaeroides DSM 2875]
MERHAKGDDDKQLIQQWRESIGSASGQDQALSLDVEMANLLKGLMRTTQEMRYWDEQSYEQWIRELNGCVDNIFMQINDTDDAEMNEKETWKQRLMYYELVSRISWVPETVRRMSQALLENYQTKQSQYMPMREKVMEKLKKAQEEGQPLTQELVEQLEEYLKFSDEVKALSEQYKTASQLFIGQLLLPQILRGRKS